MPSSLFRILVVDDEPTARLFLQAALQNAGFEVILAVDGADALRQFCANPCDMVMLDVDMPGINGYEVCAALRTEAGDEVPIIMVTGMDDVESIKQAYDAGATDFIAKPINWSLIGYRVKYLLRSYMSLFALRMANANHAAILAAIPDLMFEIDLEGRYLAYHSPRSDLLAAPSEGIIGSTVNELLPQEAAAVCMAALHEAHKKSISTGKHLSLTLQNGVRWFELSVARKAVNAGQMPTFIMLSRDITERKEAEHKILRLAYFDSLTGLHNRLSFLERLAREIKRAKFRGIKLGILFLDLDGFKNINDTLGHAAGDRVLQCVADRLRLGVRPMDMVSRLDSAESEAGLARLGGDEFTVIVPDMAQNDDALVLAQRIAGLIRQPFNLEGEPVMLTASIGIAIYPDDGETADVLLKYADTAMYHAKDNGRDNCKFYNASLTRQAVQRMNLENNLRLALERNEFFLLYQPQLDVKSGQIRSVEALIRWKHPEHGLILPMDFIPLAEKSGLIVPIGEWVLRTACSQATLWQAAHHFLRVAVNLSPVQFKNPNLLNCVTDILATEELAPEWLELEVTESTLMENSDATLATLQALREVFVRISLDDFGTGYSSMSYLTRLPLNTIKMDQSFVRRIPDDGDSLIIVRAIVSLARNLGFTVTAEGVETLEQAQILRRLACETLQGYYFSKPVPASSIPALLNRKWSLASVDGGRQKPLVTRRRTLYKEGLQVGVKM